MSLVPEPWAVRAAHRELATTVTLDVVPAGGGPPPPFAPAQFSMLTVFGVGEVPISISSDPAERDHHAYTVRAAGAVTTALCGLQPGDVIGLRGPLGNRWGTAAAEGGDVVFVAGGIGIAPLRSAIHEVLARRDRYGRVAILYGSRGPDDILYAGFLHELRQRFDLDVAVTVDRPTRDWQGDVGLVTALVPRVAIDWPHATAFVCGPDVMMRAVGRTLVEAGADPARVELTLERNMRCGVGLCGHCQLGRIFVCTDGPVVAYGDIASFYSVAEV
jgi:NAD(P)H-flavin reductase